VYDFDEQAATLETRVSRNLGHGLGAGTTISLLGIDAGSSGAALSVDGRDEIPGFGAFVTVDTLNSATNPESGTWAEFQAERLFGDAQSWTFTLDGRHFQPLARRHGLAVFSLASFQTGEPGVDLPEYLQFALGGANSVRGWSLGSRIGRNQFLGTLEYSYVAVPVRPFSVAGLNAYAGLQLVSFADLGLASHAGADTTTATSAIDGYGVGLRLLVPFVDVIRLEVAWGEPGHGATAYFGISLMAVRQRQRVR
jgi:outer membrane protein assembly factor BamA